METAFIAFYRNHVRTGKQLTGVVHCWVMPAERYESCLKELRGNDHITIVGYGLAINKWK